MPSPPLSGTPSTTIRTTGQFRWSVVVCGEKRPASVTSNRQVVETIPDPARPEAVSARRPAKSASRRRRSAVKTTRPA